MNSPTIEYVISNTNTVHISISNYDNHFCYWVSILQRLHTSPTLNKLVKSIQPDEGSVFYTLMKPVQIYANIDLNASDTNEQLPNSGNTLSIYQQLINYFNETIPNFVHQKAQNGYIPWMLMIFFYCPAIYYYFPNDFLQIVNEIHINRIDTQ